MSHMDKTPPGFRLERDSMGTVRVPVEAHYGSQTQRAVENFFNSGLKPRARIANWGCCPTTWRPPSRRRPEK
jgi:hypothetical protein